MSKEISPEIEWLNGDGGLQESLRLGIEFGVFEFDGLKYALAEDWRQRAADMREACVDTE